MLSLGSAFHVRVILGAASSTAAAISTACDHGVSAFAVVSPSSAIPRRKSGVNAPCPKKAEVRRRNVLQVFIQLSVAQRRRATRVEPQANTAPGKYYGVNNSKPGGQAPASSPRPDSGRPGTRDCDA